MTLAGLRARFAATGAGRWYYTREPGEQRIVAVVTVLVVLAVLWLAIWKPVSDWREVENNRYRNAQAELDWLQANEGRARALAASGGGRGGDRSLVPVITRSAKAQGIEVSRLQPEANGVVSVALQGQPFNELLSWLHQLEVNNGVQILRVAVDAEGRSGRVNAQIRLQ